MANRQKIRKGLRRKALRSELQKIWELADFRWQNTNFDWRKTIWIQNLTEKFPARNKRRRKISPLFWPVYDWLIRNSLSKKNLYVLFTEMQRDAFREKLKAKTGINNLPIVCVVDTDSMAQKLGVTKDNIIKQLNVWTDQARHSPAPLVKLGMFGNKNNGGRQIICIGYFGMEGMAPVNFLSKQRAWDWLQEQLFEEIREKIHADKNKTRKNKTL